MKRYVIMSLLFCGCSLSSCSQLPLRTYSYVNIKMNWSEAQQYCRANYDDLATIESLTDISTVNAGFTYTWAWIGLNDDPNSWIFNMGHDSNSWRWSATGETSTTGYQNWLAGQPDDYQATESCVVMTSSGQWNDVPCGVYRYVICYNVTNLNEKIHVFRSKALTWSSAQAYCRQYYTDLTTIDSSGDNAAAYSVKPPADEVWIGLYRVPWSWSDKFPSPYRNWQSGSPNNYLGTEYCVGMNSQHQWDDLACGNVLNVVCHRVSKQKTTMRIQIKTNADISNPGINVQILQQLQAALSAQGWTEFHLLWNTEPHRKK